MSFASLSVRRVMLFWLTLCVAGTGLAYALPRLSESGAEVKAEEVAAEAVFARVRADRVRQAGSVPSVATSRRATCLLTAVRSAIALRPTLRTLQVRTQV